MSKTKSSTKAAKPSKSDVLSKAKNAGVTKPSKDAKSKAEVAKKLIEKEEKKSKKDKKKVKEPTPEPSSSEEEEQSSESESSESESEAEVKKTAKAGKLNGAKQVASTAKAADSSESESEESESSESSEDDEPALKKGADKKAAVPKTNGVKINTKADESSDESESDSDEEGPAAVLGKAPAVDEVDDDSSESESSDDEEEAKPKTNGAKVEASESSEEEEDDDSDSDSDSGSEEEEEKPAVKVNKRKAEEAADVTAKKAKTAAPTTPVDETKKTLFVGNLSWNVDDAWLQEVFEEHGNVSAVRVQMDKMTGRAKGYAYVDFATAEDAAKAYEAKTGFELDGRVMNLDFANSKPDDKTRQENRRKSYGDQLSEPTDTLFVGNLSFDVGQEQVSEAFSPYGTILGVRLPTDPNSGAPRGFGHVSFASVDDAKAALEAMQGGYIGDRPVRLDYSQPRPPRDDSGFGGGGRGRGGFGGRGRGGDRGRGGRGGNSFGGRGRGGAPRGGRGGSTNRGGFGDFKGQRQTFD